MDITFFIGSMARGGAERVISILANDYCSRGWNVDIVLLLKNKVEYPLDSGIRIVDLSPESGGYLKNAACWFFNIRRYLVRRQPDRVVSFVGRINALVQTAALGLKMHVVVSERNDPKHDGRGRMMKSYCNAVYHHAKAVVFQNEYQRGCFSSKFAGKSYVIPNPVSVTAYKENHEYTTVATAGRLIEQKNQAMLIRAMERLHRKYPELKCKIYGEGPLREKLQQQIVDLGLKDTITLEGNVPDIHEKLAQCGIFVMTSNYEGLSNALIEAMMVGLPCITTDYPGARELITDGENGIAVPLDDDVALAKQIELLIKNESGCTDILAQKGREESAKYRAEAVLKRWHDVIDR